jgi:DNA repair exonuclease SbcCD ATPase subunit
VSDNSKIIRLTSENVKRISAVEIKPDGNMVIIGGKNGAGKSSVLDSIFYTLGGKSSLPVKPLREGSKRGFSEVELDDLVIRRTFNEGGGTTLTITNKHDDSTAKSPQAILDALVGKLSFDPLEFARGSKPEDDRRRSETLRSLVGIDFTADNAERDKVYQKRTKVNAEVDAIKSRIAALPPLVEGVPDIEVSSAEILAEQQKAAELNANNQKARDQLSRIKDAIGLNEDDINLCKERIKELEVKLGREREQLEKLVVSLSKSKTEYESRHAEVKKLVDTDLAPFQTRAKQVEETNKSIRSNSARVKLQVELDDKQTEAEDLTMQIEEIDYKKQRKISSAKFPIDGLTVDSSGEVLFSGIPFSQASSAQQLRASLAIGLGLNPKLKVVLIRDGSLLDEESLKMVAEAAKAAGAQIWMEKVSSDGQGCSVVIEDGHIKE